MTNQELLRIAMEQSAIELNCYPDDFLKTENDVHISSACDGGRKYLTLPFDCHLVSYGNNVVAAVHPNLVATVKHYLNQRPAAHCFETPYLYVLNDALEIEGFRICYMAEYFLPDLRYLQLLPCPYQMKVLPPAAFAHLYRPEWSNALCEKRKWLDVLCVGAYDNGNLIGLAGASADCDRMWQIGIDVLPAYRRRGVASALTARLALEILEYGKVPFYCAAWSNIRSVRNAIASGFRPSWIELTAKSCSFVSECNA